MRKIGDRIGAILSFKDGIYKLLGYGTYVDNDDNEMIPKLMLDDGNVVYGYECWWGDEQTIKDKLKGQQVVDVDVGDMRKCQREGAQRAREEAEQEAKILLNR